MISKLILDPQQYVFSFLLGPGPGPGLGPKNYRLFLRLLSYTRLLYGAG